MGTLAGRAPAKRSALSANTLLGFLILGLGVASIGPALPWLTQYWGVRLDDGGTLFTANFGSAAVGVVVSGLLLDRLGRKPVLVGGLLLIAIGLGGLAFAPSLAVGLGCMLLFGLGTGCLDVTLNVFVADLYPTARGAALNLMNVLYGVGSLLAPLVVGAALTFLGAPQAVMLGVSALALLGGGVYLLLGFPARAVAPAPVARAAAPGPWAGLAVLREGYVLTLVLMFFLYVGLEVGFGGWAYSFAIQGAHLEAGIAALVVSVYWIALTLGRLGAGLVSGRISGASLVLGGALLGAAGAATIMLFPGSPAALFAGAALLGAGFAPIFPTAIGLATERYPAAAGVVSSVAVLGGSLGGAVLPYVQGRLLVDGGVPLAVGAMLIVALAVAGLQLALTRGFAPAPRVRAGGERGTAQETAVL